MMLSNLYRNFCLVSMLSTKNFFACAGTCLGIKLQKNCFRSNSAHSMIWSETQPSWSFPYPPLHAYLNTDLEANMTSILLLLPWHMVTGCQASRMPCTSCSGLILQIYEGLCQLCLPRWRPSLGWFHILHLVWIVLALSGWWTLVLLGRARWCHFWSWLWLTASMTCYCCLMRGWVYFFWHMR